ncbi:ThiF family adenylyltransferase [Allorhizocola rhizosphaerae]|uniref:ThiF family adenylyltransferase n=1 Tax=Allorhizocola rhizosphaerae TaxID=1872709 RepID=UPI000E3C5F04|nr:ThiF family adenylyltransferase [Allorhizocola rhizosphaerae]
MSAADRYSRQRGLVVQDLIADARLSVYGTGKALPYLLQCLAALGFAARHGRLRLCLADREVLPADVAHQFLLRPEDVGGRLGAALVHRLSAVDPAIAVDVDPLPLDGMRIATPTAAEVAAIARQGDVAVWGQVLPLSIHIGPSPVEVPDDGPNVLTAALAAISGGLTAQAVLGLLGALVRGPAVLSSWVEERLWVSYPGIGRRATLANTDAPALRGLLDPDDDGFEIIVHGRAADARVTAIVDGDTVVASVPLGPEAVVAGPGRAAVRPVHREPIAAPTIDWSPLATGDVVLPERLPQIRLVMCGAGALGSWASATLAATPADGTVELCVVDMDDTIEAHNLNRQILFDLEDVGLPKARLAAQRLTGINPMVGTRALQMVIAPQHRDALIGEMADQDYISDPDIAAQRMRLKELRERLREADAVLSCPDNQQTRWVLNVVTESLGIPLVNGAVDGFVGRVHVCDPRDDGRCLICWLGASIARQPERRSCTDILGTAPVPAIVTSAAVVGGIQTAALIALLTGHAKKVGRFHALDAARGELTGYRAADRDPVECPTHLLDAEEMMARASHA